MDRAVVERSAIPDQRGDRRSESACRADGDPARPDRAELVDLLAADARGRSLLDPLLETAIARTSGDADAELDRAIRDHARQRFRDGFDLRRAIEELVALRESVMQSWDRDAPGSPELLRELNRTIDEAILVHVQEYRLPSEMLAMVCHDLKNPLQSVLLSATLLERADDPKVAKPAEVVIRATNRMNRVLEDLSVLAAMDASQEPVLAPHDPTAIAAELVEAHRGAAEEKKQVLGARVEQPARSIMIDRNRVLRVIHHLIQHGIRTTPPGSSLTLRVKTDERTARFTVEHAGRAVRSLDLAIARTLAGPIGGDVRVERDGAEVSLIIFG